MRIDGLHGRYKHACICSYHTPCAAKGRLVATRPLIRQCRDCQFSHTVITLGVMPLPSVLDEIDRLFDELIRRPWGSNRQLVPAEVREVEDGWLVQLPIPGLSAADLQVHVQGNRLTISGQRRQARERHSKGTWTQTSEQVTFDRTIALPPGADPETIDAKVEGSTLSIHIHRRKP